MSAVDQLLERLDKVKQSGDRWMACCPAHDDSTPSLSVGRRTNGDPGAVVKCFAGCDADAIVRAVGLTPADLFDAPPARTERRIVAAYSYVDEVGEVLFQAVRYDPKGFRQRRPDGAGGWTWSTAGVRKVLYRLPAVIEAVERGDIVYVCEGEKDAEAMVAAGVCATTAPQGAGNFRHTADNARQVLAGATVVIVHDQDPAGLQHARQVADILRDVAGSVSVCKPRGRHNDAADHLGAGYAVNELEPVAGDRFTNLPDLADWIADDEQGDTTTDNEASTAQPLVAESFWPVDLGAVLDGDLAQPEPTILRRDDRRALLYPGEINEIHGDSGVGKGWLTLYAVDQQLRAGRTVMLVDAEDTARSIVARLQIIGTPTEAIRERLLYIRPTDPFTQWNLDHLLELIGERGPSLVVLDSLGECFGLDGVNENHDAEVGPWLRRVARPIADAGPAVLLIDHTTKAADNPLHASGSKRKRAAVGGASYLLAAATALSAEKGGRLRVKCAKDRHGNFRTGEVVADLVLEVGLVGRRFHLYAPTPSDDTTEIGVLLAARSAVAAAKQEGVPLSQAALVGLMAIKAKTEVKRGGIDLAVARGALKESKGGRNARMFEYVRDLDEPDI